jgi:hypothetical protein
MKRTSQSRDSSIRSNEEGKLPSKEMIDLFGRFVGTVVSTVFEGVFMTFGTRSEFQSQLGTSMADFFRSFVVSAPSTDHRSCSREFDGEGLNAQQKEKSETPGTETEGETAIESELADLKRRLSEKSACQGEEDDRSIALISRATPFFNREGEWTYQVCPFPGKPSFEGLISCLTKAAGGNPHDKELISATGASHYGSSNARNVAEFGTETYFGSNNIENQWMCYDFKDLRVSVTHYLIRTPDRDQGWCHLRSWVIEGSQDGSNWTELDRRENDPRLNGPKSTCNCEIRNVIETRFVRIRSIGPTWRADHYLWLTAFELFGALGIPKSVKLM